MWGSSHLVVPPSGGAQGAAISRDYQDGLPVLVAAIHALVARIGAVVPVSSVADHRIVARIEAIESREVFPHDPQGLVVKPKAQILH